MKECVIIAAGDLGDPAYAARYAKGYVICADGGIYHADRMGIAPDLIVGDWDSGGDGLRGRDCEILAFPPEKDSTDTGLALAEAVNRGYDHITILAGVGRRLDHTLANIQSMAFYVQKHQVQVRMLHSENSVYILEAPGTLYLTDTWNQYISLFAFTPEVTGITLSNMRYPLVEATLTHTFPLGVSNESLGDQSSIYARSGTLVVVTSRE